MVGHSDIDKNLILFQNGIELLVASIVFELKGEIVVLNDQVHALEGLLRVVNPPTLLLNELIGYLD